MVPLKRLTSAVAACLCIALEIAAPLRAQSASPYLPLDDAAYDYIDALMVRGGLQALPLLERPYTIAQIRSALAADSTGRGPQSWRTELERTLDRYERHRDSAARAEDGVALAGLDLLAGAQTSGRRELIAADTGRHVTRGLALSITGNSGPIAVGLRVRGDTRLRYDPDYFGSRLRATTGRTEDGYLSLQARYGELFFGRAARNWGPPEVDGLQVGASPYSYDHLLARVGGERAHLTLLFARLDPYPRPDSLDYERYFATHRVAVRWNGLEMAAAEGAVYGGPRRGVVLQYLNPLNVYELSQFNEREPANTSYSADASWRWHTGARVAAQFFLDDIQIDKCDSGCSEPPSYGLTVAAAGLPAGGSQRWSILYTKVTNLTYRTPQPWERYAGYGNNLGRRSTDYDEAVLDFGLAVPMAGPLHLYVASRRQGMGNSAEPYPTMAQYSRTPTFLAGIVERTRRLGVRGALLITDRVTANWDVGYNDAANYQHLPGQERRSVQGRISVAIASPRLRLLP